MADIAQLGIAVDTSQTKLAARELDNLAAAGAKAEGSTKKLGSTSKQAMEQAAAATAKAQQTMERMLAAQERQEKLMEQMAREMQQLNQALQGNASANNAAAQAAQHSAQAMGQQSRAAKDAQGAIEGASKASGGSAKSMNDAERAAVAMGAGLARAVAVAGALAAAVGVLMVSVAKSATEIERFALMADATPEQLQRMAAGAKTAGMGLENYASTIKDVQDKIGDFMQTGGGELKDFFEKIAPQVGVTADSFKNLSGPDALQLFYNSLEKANLSQKETVFWMEAIANDATNLIPLLQQNGAGFEAAADRAQKYGAVLSDYALAASKEFKSQTDEMALAIEGASNILAVGLMPVVSETIDSLLAYSAESGAAEVATNAVKAVLETLIVVASDVAFVFKGVGTEIGGIAAQAGAFLSLDFSRVKAIREMMKEDASAAKAELDAFQQRVLNADKAAKATFAVTDAVKKAKFGTEEYVTAVNGLIKAQASGQITTAQMNATLRSVSPAATSAGKSLSGMGIGAEKAKKASEDAAKAASQYAKELSATYAELNGVSNDYYGQIEKYQAQLKKRDITEAQYIELMEKLIQKQPFAVALTKAQTEAFKEQEDARKKAYDATEKAFQQEVETAQKSAKAVQEKVGQLSDEAQAIEISKAKHITLAEAMEEVIVKRLEDQLESAKQAGNQELLDAIAAEIKARKELGQALGDREVREAADDAAQDAAKSWKATADKINNDLTDAIIAGFEGGKNGAQALKDSLVKMFKDMVLRPVISAIVAPVSGMLATGAQAATSAIGGSGFGGSIVSSLAGNVLGSLGAVGGAISGFGTSALAATQSLIGMTGTAAQMATSLAAAGHTAAAGMQAGANAFAAIPGWGWVVGGIALLASLGIGDTPGEQHQGGIYSSSGKTDMDTAMRVTGGGGWDDGAWARDLTERADAAIGSSLEKVGTGLIDIFEQVNALAGGVADEFELTLGFAANLNGEGKDKNAFGYFDLISKDTGEVLKSYQNRELGTDTGAAMTKLTNDAARAMLDALAKADVPQWAQNVLQELEAVPGLQAMQEFLAYPQKLADSFGIAQESMAGAIAEGFKTGDGEAAGQALAQTVLSGIQNSIIGAASQQISTLVTNVILTPILDALANAQDPAAALAAIDFDAVIAQAEGIGEGLATALNNPALQAAMDKIDATLQQVGQSAVGAAGNLQLIATAADQVADAPAPAPAPAPATSQSISGGGGGGAISIPVGGFVDPNVYRIDLTDIAQQTADALDKIAESIKNLGKVTPKSYAAIDEQARQKFSELNGDYLAGLVDFGEQSRAKSIALGKIGEEIKAFYDASGAWSDISAGQAEELIEKLRKSSDLPAGLVDHLYAGYGSDYGAFFDKISLYVMDLRNAAWQVSEDMNGNKDELDSLNQQINQWSLAQKRLLATDELVSLATEAAEATAKIEELKRTGGLTDPIAQLKELYAKKMTDIDSGINAALQAEIDKKKGTAADYSDYSVQLADFLKNGGGQFGTQQEYEDFVAKGKKILGDSFMGPMIGSENPWPEILQKMINELNADVSAMTAEQQSYIKGLEDWYAVQKELLSTEMLVDINNQIKALEAEEKGPLTTIKEAIQKYADDFEELGTLTEEVQAQLDKLSGLQLDQARTSLYDQLLSQEERRAKEQEKLNAAFTELGATTPASTDALRAMIDAARDAGNVGLADSLLELVPAFVALQGSADGAGSALDRAMQDVDKAFAALQRSINAEKDRINADAQAQIDAINAGAEAREKAIDDARQQVQDLGSIFDDITNAVKTLRGNAQDEAMQMEQARAYISMALSVAQAGGTVDREKLREAMGTVTKDNAQSYVSGGDYRFAQARQAAELQALADITGEQKDVAQATLDAALEANKAAQEQIDAIIEARDKQLKALEEQLKKAQEQIDVMKGVDISVLGVGDAVIAFDTAMATYQSEKSRVDAENLALQAAIDEKIKQQKEQDLEICIMQVDAINQMSSDIVSAIGSIPAPVQPPPSSSGPVITYDGDQGPGLYVNGGLTGDIMPKFPSFDVGTNYVPNDMIAQIHEGEAIVPKEFNPAAFGGVKTDDAQLASLVVSLTTEVQRLQAIVKAGNDEQRRTADAVNGRPEAPMLVETV